MQITHSIAFLHSVNKNTQLICMALVSIIPTDSIKNFLAHASLKYCLSNILFTVNTNVFYQDYEAGVPLTALLQHGPFNTWTYYVCTTFCSPGI